MHPLIVFRADASVYSGTGHVLRCLFLAEALQDQGAVVVFVFRSGLIGEKLFEGRTFKAVPLPVRLSGVKPNHDDPPHATWLATSWQDDAYDTMEALKGLEVAAVVVDHYALDARWHEAVSTGLGCPIVAIDDLADRPLLAELIVDHNYVENHMLKFRNVNLRGVPILGGPKFSLLARSYRSAPPNKAAAKVRSIGIFMGGIDRDNYSVRAIRALREVSCFSGEIEIVSTSSNPNIEFLTEVAGLDGRCKVSLDLPDLAAFFSRHELHIGAGGSATWERCCVGAPSIGLILADNQRHSLGPIADLKVLEVVETPAPDVKTIGTRTREIIDRPSLRREFSENSKKLVDGHGCARIADAIISLC